MYKEPDWLDRKGCRGPRANLTVIIISTESESESEGIFKFDTKSNS